METINKYVITSYTDLNGNITDISDAYCRICGYSKSELIGKPHKIVRDPNTPSIVYKELWETIKSGDSWKGELQNIGKNGESYWIDTIISPIFDEKNKNITGYYSISYDITAKKQAEYLSTTDQLTKIPNRLKLDEVFEYEISLAQRYETEFSIILVDIDHFKSVNDNYGHNIGDIVLKEFANRLRSNIRTTDTLGRWGGEEFLIICPKTSSKDAYNLAQKLRSEVYNKPFPKVGLKSASFGVYQYSLEDTIEMMTHNADSALYQAKENGRNQVIIYNSKEK